MEPLPATPAPSGRTDLSLPQTRPIVTYFLLAVIGVVFLLEVLLGGSTSMETLYIMGAQVNSLVAAGEVWRLFTAMFLHIGITHFAFNAWALLSLGRDLESYYGSPRFVLIYLFSGLAGGVAYFLVGPPNVLSAGASGAIFGLVGAELAFILSNHRLFGSGGRQRLVNLAALLAVNLLLGFTVPGINNIAHIGGFVGGLLLGLALTPRYGLVAEGWAPGSRLRLQNRTPRLLSVAGTVVGFGLLALGIQLGG
jgi:rhomboid protease GluP